MFKPACLATLLGVALTAAAISAAPLKVPPPNPLSLLTAGSPDALAGALRGYLCQALPDPLFEDSKNWGHTVRVARGVKWVGKGLNVHPDVVKKDKPHGAWRKVRLSAINPRETLVVDLRNSQLVEPGRFAFEIFLSCDARVEVDQQTWESGLKLYDDTARARFRLRLRLACEATGRLEANGQLLPDAVFRLRVTSADVSYDNFVTEHVAGVGGELARLMGSAAKRGLNQWHPSLERELLAKASAAIVKAGDSKDVRINLAKLLAGKK
jgi:hypothetical protein